MKKLNRKLIVLAFVVLLIVSWVVVLGIPSNNDVQAELIRQAEEYIADGVFILAVPLLEDAAGMNAAQTDDAEYLLKGVYLELIDQRGFRRRYLDLLDRQMRRRDAPPEIFMEAAKFHLEDARLGEAFAILREGIARTESEELIDLFEAHRYAFRMGRDTYDDVTAIFGTTIGVSRDGLWGIANSDGTLLIPIEYEQVSTFSAGRAIVQQNGVISAINQDNNRVALLRQDDLDFTILGFGNFANERIALHTSEGWRRATGSFLMGAATFEEIGTYSGGFAAARQNGRWGVIGRENTWLIPPEHDEIIMDELGRAYAQGAVFVRNGNAVHLFVNGRQVGESFEDARPFGEAGYAAVMRNGLWGFINNSGELMIDFQFADALSFGQHLAAVKIIVQEVWDVPDTLSEHAENSEWDGEIARWGFISLRGEMVIEPEFLNARSFANGSAPVLTPNGWRFITLVEFMRGASM